VLPLLTLLLGCPRPAIPPGQTVVEDVHFVGNGWGPFAKDGSSVLADTIDTRATRRLIDLPGPLDLGPYVGDVNFRDAAVLAEDAERIVTWYAHHGWFDARFVGWDERPRRRPGPGGAAGIDLVGRIERGTPTRLAEAPRIEGVDELAGPIRGALQKVLTLGKGDVFDLEAYLDGRDALQARLRERGYAYAAVTGRVDVRADLHEADIVYTVVPGRPCVFGTITVTGEAARFVGRVKLEADLEPGEGFRASKLVSARQRLYGLGVYSLVEVVPVLRTPDAREVPIEIRLSRRPSREFALGPRLDIQTNTQELAAVTRYQDDDALKRLWRWKVEATGGIASAVDVSQPSDVEGQFVGTLAPVGDVSQSLTVPNVLGKTVAFTGTTVVRLDRLPSYREFEAEARPAFTWTPDRRITLASGYRLKYHRYFDFEDLAQITRTRLSSTISPETLLSALEQSLTWDARDDKLAPTRNYYVSALLTEAGGPFGGDLDFFRVLGEARAYRSLRFGGGDPHTVLAGRIGGGVLVPYEADAGVDIDEALYLGGSTTVRGWPEGRLGPHLCYLDGALNLDPTSGAMVCSGDTDGDGLSDVTIEGVGGVVSAFANAELRQDLPMKLRLALFVDAGRVWNAFDRVDPLGLQWSVGVGLRYVSPIGPIRLDFGWVPSPDPYFADEPGYAFHFGIGEAF
jgi:outer membrane protein insertion porin family/translocation and assembly module TamA